MNGQEVKYSIDKSGYFIVDNFNWAKPFSSFFPGIGGKWGISLWGYYVNRAQGISSLGIRDKDGAIMEFFSFNKACQLIGSQGFRTFIKLSDDILYEPFRQSKNPRIFQKMIIPSHGLELHEINTELNLKTEIEYFPLVNLPVAGFVRNIKICNLSNYDKPMEIVDGLPLILPFGMNQHCIKFISRHIEAMMQVKKPDGIPYYKLKQMPQDTPEVLEVLGGNFYFSHISNKNTPINYIVDPNLIFGSSESFLYPLKFATKKIKDILKSKQMCENKTPSALTLFETTIPKNESLEFFSVIGNVSSEKGLVDLKNFITTDKNLNKKREENISLIHQIKEYQFTASSNKNFDGYCKQTFLDNVMRGGLPIVFKNSKSKNIFYLYARKHGDMERDYNHFIVENTYLSQGNAHFRDVNQNRRVDVWFEPEVEDKNVRAFFNLLQLDGYNPLVVNGLTYTVKDIINIKKWLKKLVKNGTLFEQLIKMVKRDFTPGEFIMKLEGVNTSLDYGEIVTTLLSFCRENGLGQPSEGFWVDHWTYNLDLIDNYLTIYPEKLEDLLTKDKSYTFFDNADIVQPREKKYVLVDGKIRQYGAVVRDKKKVKLLSSRREDPYKVRTNFGKGKIYTTNLLVKLLSLITNKVASLDPFGIGMEMEADKPGWNDPLNGLPALLTSSVGETFELIRCCAFLNDAILSIDKTKTIPIYEELYKFITHLTVKIDKRIQSKEKKGAFTFWEDSHTIKEIYRKNTTYGISGKEIKTDITTIQNFINKTSLLLNIVFENDMKDRVFHKNGIVNTYLINRVTKYELIYSDKNKKKVSLNPKGLPLITPIEFEQKPVSLFLEGSVHLLKIKKNLGKKIYKSIKNSDIYDKKLKMYKTNAPINSESFEIGRARVYLPGWIENESIYLHMEYKYLLEILKAELYNQFFEEVNNLLIPFLKPEIYGRSILENSSFIVSSAFPNYKMHGRGFQARLTGATAEFLNMWIIMVAGKTPFFIDNGLKLRFSPILPGYLFTKKKQIYSFSDEINASSKLEVPKNSFAFRFLGKTLVIYHNKKRMNTFGKNCVKVASATIKYFDGRVFDVSSDVFDTQFALDIRNKKVERIDISLE